MIFLLSGHSGGARHKNNEKVTKANDNDSSKQSDAKPSSSPPVTQPSQSSSEQLHLLGITSGRYCKEKRRQDCIILSFDSTEQTISVVYSDGRGSRPILTEGYFMGKNNTLTAFTVHWIFRKTTKFVLATGKVDTDRLLEIVPPKVNEEEDDNSRPAHVWRRNPLNVEVAVITDVKDPEKVKRAKQMLAESFPETGEHHPHAYLWSGVRAQACPTHDMGVYNDENHDVSKIVGTTTAHFRIWVEFYRRHRHNNPNARIIIFEEDALCSEKDCGDRAIRQIQVSKADIFYLGWCYYHGDKYLKNYPPLCLHAYSLTVRGAFTLMNNVYPCLKPGDNQVADLGYHKKLSWAIANITGSPLVGTPGSTKGLWRQVSLSPAPTSKPTVFSNSTESVEKEEEEEEGGEEGGKEGEKKGAKVGDEKGGKETKRGDGKAGGKEKEEKDTQDGEEGEGGDEEKEEEEGGDEEKEEEEEVVENEETQTKDERSRLLSTVTSSSTL